jgi:transcriptional regulator with XRE-family HTH domain
MAENYKGMDDFEKEGGIVDHEDQLLESFGESELDLGVFTNTENSNSAQETPDCTRKTSLKGPGYRRKRIYTKSVAKYREERKRRKRVCELSNLNQEEIAKRLGISVRTVQRDQAKIKPYHLGQFNRFCRELREKEMREYNESSESLSLPQRAKLLIKLLDRQRKEEEAHKRFLRTFFIDIDLDRCAADGFPEAKPFIASHKMNLKEGIQFVVVFRKNGQKYAVNVGNLAQSTNTATNPY